MKRSRRTDRMCGQLLKEISSSVIHVVKDPRIRNVTFTRVEITSDLRKAYVFYSVLGEQQQQEEASQGLESAKGIIKRELGHRLSLRYMPDLEFTFDPSIQHAEHIQKLLRDIEIEDTKKEEDVDGLQLTVDG